jgi:DNA modification methylase
MQRPRDENGNVSTSKTGPQLLKKRDAVNYEPLSHIPGIGSYDGNAMGHLPGDKNSKIKEIENTTSSLGNNHPTVKPVELMKYLVKLVTPAGGKVLDPFNGSGSTGMACVELGYEYVGCELDPEYLEIANKRISAWGEKHKGFVDLFEED